MDKCDSITLSAPYEVEGYGCIIDVRMNQTDKVLIALPSYISYDIAGDDYIIFKYNKDSIEDVVNVEKIIQKKIYENQDEWLDQHLTKNDIRLLTQSSIREFGSYFTISCRMSQEIYDIVSSENRPFSPEISIDHILCKSDSFSIKCVLSRIIRNLPELRFHNVGKEEDIPVASLSSELEEVTIDEPNQSETVKLTNPTEIYKQLYKKEKKKAKEYRRQAIDAYLKAKDIKMRYMVTDIDISDDSDDEHL
uniref:Uncharacterized protein n=1 Tax=viral metagenome TaxID=1070528 RepID=A0A6C0BU23_9ZZZZ